MYINFLLICVCVPAAVPGAVTKASVTGSQNRFLNNMDQDWSSCDDYDDRHTHSTITCLHNMDTLLMYYYTKVTDLFTFLLAPVSQGLKTPSTPPPELAFLLKGGD